MIATELRIARYLKIIFQREPSVHAVQTCTVGMDVTQRKITETNKESDFIILLALNLFLVEYEQINQEHTIQYLRQAIAIALMLEQKHLSIDVENLVISLAQARNLNGLYDLLFVTGAFSH